MPRFLFPTLLLSLTLAGCPGSHHDGDSGALDTGTPIDSGVLDTATPIDTGTPVDTATPIDTATPVDATSCDVAQDARGEGGCEAELGVIWTGFSCASISGCSCVGADCDALYESHEACVADHPGCPRSCGGLTPFGSPYCLSTELCDYPDGSLCGGDDSQGLCVPRPTDCHEPGGVPVCGCNGTNYLTECSANLAGVDILRTGVCPED